MALRAVELLAAVGVMLACVQRPLYRAQDGCIRLVCDGVVDAQIPHHDGMTLRDGIMASPALAKFGLDKVEALWYATRPTHSALTDGGEALKRLLIAQKPDWWRVIANHWPDLLGPPPARHISFDEPLKSGDAVHLIMMW